VQQERRYTFFLVCQGSLTKFVVLYPLEYKKCEEVDIFTILEASSISQSDGGREFFNGVVGEVCFT
jgi:hypothetical protein